MTDEELISSLNRIENTLDEVLSLLRPVNAHAEWVDGLRDKLHHLQMGMCRGLVYNISCLARVWQARVWQAPVYGRHGYMAGTGIW